VARASTCAVVLTVSLAAAGCSSSSSSSSSSPASGASSSAAPAAAPVKPPEKPPAKTPEETLRTEVATWKGVPYVDGGTDHKGADQPGFVSAVFKAAFGVAIPETEEEQVRTGKLVERGALAPGDLVFFDGKGFGPFRPHLVAIYLGHDEVAIDQKPTGVATVKLTDAQWTSLYKTARRISLGPKTGAPTFNAASYGSNRGALLREIAKAWSGTLYLQGGTTFDGIGNDEFVREVYGAIYETDLDGTPKDWATIGASVPRDKLEPGDIILYQAVGIGGVFNQKHAGMYIGDGEFVHSVKGSAVTISRLDDPRWATAFRDARRIDPDAMEAAREARATKAAAAAHPAPKAAAKPAPKPAAPPAATQPTAAPVVEAPPEPGPPPIATPTATAPMLPTAETGDRERKLDDAIKPWIGTPYRIGGTTKSGVDCSAFVGAVYLAAFDVKLPRTAEEQEQLGKVVKREDLEVGDLVFFRTQGMGPLFKSRHVGVYVGHGQFAQASGRLGVTVTNLDNAYWRQKYESARRLPTPAAPVPVPGPVR
jgi:cell wall-associated NlpC family hydrolase